MPRRTVWVAVLNISWRTAEKITGLHEITADEVRQAVVCVRGLSCTWHTHPERGERAIVSVKLRGRDALIVLYPTVDADMWNLGSAYFTDV